MLKYDDGAVAPRREGEHVKSVQTYAEDAWRRLYKRAVPEGDPLEHEEFETFYRRLQKAMQRTSYVENRGNAVTSGGRINRHEHGRRMAPSEEVRAAAEGSQVTAPPQAVPTTAPDSFSVRKSGTDADTDADSRDVVWEMERSVAKSEELHKAFTHAITAGRLVGPRRSGKGRRFERRRARDADGRPHYLSVGWWREEEVQRKGTTRAVRVPWLIAEIDGRGSRGDKNRQISDQLARRLLRRLKEFGVDLSEVVVSYSGNASIHVRIPDGVVGCPIYRSEQAATSALRRFFDEVCRDDTGLRKAIDNTVLRPSQLIRAIGSVHEDTGRRTVGTTADRYLKKPSSFLWSLSEPEFRYSPPESYPLPRRAEFNPKLAGILYTKPPSSDSSPEGNVSQLVSSSTGAVARLRDGVSEGEAWGLDVGGYAHAEGRNWAALIWSHFVLGQDQTERNAKDALRKWNKQNDPPLPENELRRVFDHALRYRVRQSRTWTPT